MFDIFTDYPDISLYTYDNCTYSPTYAPDRLSSCIKSIHQWLTSNSLKLNPTKTEAIFPHLPLRSYTLPEPPSSHSTTPHYPTFNTSETFASILIPPFPLTPILYIWTHPSTTTYTASACSDAPFPSPSLLPLPPPTSSPYSTIATPYSVTSLNTNSSNYSDYKTL